MRLVLRILTRLLGALLALALIGLAYLHVRGAPEFLRRFVVEQLAQTGVAAEFGAIRLELFRGVVATEAVLASVRQPDRPWVRIDDVQLVFDWVGLWHRRNAIRALHIANARLTVPLPADEQGAEVFTAEKAYATLHIDPDGAIRVDRLTGVYLGIRLFVMGRLKPGSAAPLRAGQPPPDTARLFAFLTKVVRELKRLHTATAPQLDLEFDIDFADPLAGWARATLQGTDWEYRGLRVSTAKLSTEMRDGTVAVKECEARLAGGAIGLQGRYDLARGGFDIHLQSTADPKAFLVFAPPEVAEAAAQVTFGRNPALKLHYQLSPETGTEPDLHGELETQDLTLRGVQFRRVRLVFQGRGPDLQVTDALVVTAAGQLTGHGQFNIESSDFQYVIDSTLDPTTLTPFMGPAIRRLVEPASFATAPHIVANVRADLVDPDNFAYDAHVETGRCRYRGVDLESASGKLRLRQNKLDVQELHLVRPEGDVRGSLLADFDGQLVKFDLAGTANPVALAPLLGPKSVAVMKPYRFGPRTTATARGTMDFAEPQRTAWEAQVTNDGFGWWKLTTDRIQARLVFADNVLRILDLDATSYGGHLRGQCVVDLNPAPPSYQFDLAAERCQLTPLLVDLGSHTKDASGLLTGQLTLRGRGTDQATMAGGGQIEVSDGILMELPLFGVFSKVLDDIVAGLGRTKITRATARYTVADQQVSTEDLEAAAGAFTLKSRGKVGFDGSLDFRVQAQLFKGVPGLNIPLILFGKMLEYKVGGTLGDASYRPLRFPKEVLPHRSGTPGKEKEKEKGQENDQDQTPDQEMTPTPAPEAAAPEPVAPAEKAP